MKMKNIIRSAQRNAKLSFLMCAAFGLCFTACSDDDESNGGGSGDLPAMSDLGITHQVTGIIDSEGNMSTFNYVDGRLTSGHTYVDNMDFTIGGSPLTVWCGVEESDGEKYEETYTDIRTNSYGAITSAKVMWREEGYGEVFEGTGTMDIEYDGNRMTKITIEESDAEGDYTYTYKAEFVHSWDGNNITKVTAKETETENDGSEEYTDTYEYTDYYEYGSNPETNSGIYLPQLAIMDSDFMCYAGLFGRTTSHIPTTYTDDDGYSTEIRVDKDEQGRITHYYWDGYLQESYLYDGQTPSAARTTINKAPAKTKGHGLMRKIAKRIIARNTGR